MGLFTAANLTRALVIVLSDAIERGCPASDPTLSSVVGALLEVIALSYAASGGYALDLPFAKRCHIERIKNADRENLLRDILVEGDAAALQVSHVLRAMAHEGMPTVSGAAKLRELALMLVRVAAVGGPRAAAGEA